MRRGPLTPIFDYEPQRGSIVVGNTPGVTPINPNTGIVWTARSAPADDWKSVCWSPDLSLFCAVANSGSNGRVMTSPDGVTWTSRTAASTVGDWISVVWANTLGLFVALAQNNASGSITQCVMTSPDGINWTIRSTPSFDFSSLPFWNGLVWAESLGKLVAVRSGAQNTNKRIMTSTDGITWTLQTTPTPAQQCIGWSPDLGLAVTAMNGTSTMRSSNATAWTGGTAPSGFWTSEMAWSPELSLFVIGSGTGDTAIMTSPDGVTWTARTAPVSIQKYGVAWSPLVELFAMTTATNKALTSPDGVTWTEQTAPSGVWESMCWSPELHKFVAVASSGTNRAMTSP